MPLEAKGAAVRIWQTDAGDLITDEQLLSALASRGGLRQAASVMDAHVISEGGRRMCAEAGAIGAQDKYAGKSSAGANGACGEADTVAARTHGRGAALSSASGSLRLKDYLKNR